MSTREEKKLGIKILDTRETISFDPEKGPVRVVEVRYEMPNGLIRSVYIPAELYSPEEALRRVKEDYQKFGVILGKEL